MARQSTSSSASSKPNLAQQASGHSAPASEGETVHRPGKATAEDETTEGENEYSEVQSLFTSRPLPFDPSLLPGGKRSLSSISTQAFWLGIAFATSLTIGAQLAWNGYTVWRPFAFIASLSLFHFLEFWVTATYNAPVVRASSFLIWTNGTPYTLAHGCALFEILVSEFIFPSWQARYTYTASMTIGLIMVIFCQASRTLAMATAGTNFNHTPQRTRQDGHELVTSGIYSLSRHPSYFAFFWWAIGTQLLVGNKFSLVAFFGSLWYFFYYRIRAEERYLIEFFGKDYEDYRKRTKTLIPFI